MKKTLSLATLVATFGFLTIAFAAPTKVSGYIMDSKCSTNAKMVGNHACAVACVKKGDSAVLVERDGTVLKIANQDKVADAVGERATLSGEVADGSITVDTVTVRKARAHKKAAAK